MPLTAEVLRALRDEEYGPLRPQLSLFGAPDIATAERLLPSVHPSRQLCMDLPPGDLPTGGTPSLPPLEVILVDTSDLAQQWATVFQEAFGYRIAAGQLLLLGENTDFYPGYHAGQAVATGCLHYSHGGRVAGMHFIGVPQQHRRKGYAGTQVRALLDYSKHRSAERSRLQASALGEHLYRPLDYGITGELPMATFPLPA